MKVVTLITGAGSGIGRACARALAAPESALVLTTRENQAGLAEVSEVARARGAEVSSLLLDLSIAGAGTELIAHTKRAFGRVDHIVSNAGKAQKKCLTETTNDDLEAAIALNTRPFLELVRAARADLLASSCGRVVAISSFVTQLYGVNNTLFPATAASKSALVALAKSLAFEFAATGVTVNCVSPGYTEKAAGRGTLKPAAWQNAKDITPNGRLATADDIAAAVTFFLSDGARHITGQVLNVDGGLSLR
ncbi:MAG: SDR family oxidoreductase [Deinococcota bacterium]